MTVNALLRMADTAMHGQAISIGSGQWSHSRENSGVNPVSVDTCAVPRETHPPACLPADLARLTCQQVTRSSSASGGLQGQAGCRTQRDFSNQ